jgi:hypothetical protein
MENKIQDTEDLPPNEKEFSIDIEKGDTTGQRFKGKFKCVCVPNLKQKAEADLHRARLNGPLPGNLSEETRSYHLVISELNARLLRAPRWFNEAGFGAEIKDFNVLVNIFNECMEAERGWRLEVWGPPAVASTIEESDEEEGDDKEDAPE